MDLRLHPTMGSKLPRSPTKLSEESAGPSSTLPYNAHLYRPLYSTTNRRSIPFGAELQIMTVETVGDLRKPGAVAWSIDEDAISKNCLTITDPLCLISLSY